MAQINGGRNYLETSLFICLICGPGLCKGWAQLELLTGSRTRDSPCGCASPSAVAGFWMGTSQEEGEF